MIAEGVDVNQRALGNFSAHHVLKGDTALLVATRFQPGDIVRELLGARAHPDARGVNGPTSLMIACYADGEHGRRESIARYLLEAGAIATLA